MPIHFPDLPYGSSDLAPYISEQTIAIHYGKHHRTYVDTLNRLIKGSPYDILTLEEIIKESAADPAKSGVFNNAAQIWNHNFYWSSMKPGGGGAPTGAVMEAINEAFGSYQGFKDAFEAAGVTQFGSGYAWLIAKGGTLEVRKTSNAQLPLIEEGAIALLTLDVWEHAYYLDYQNKRPSYVSIFLDHLVNWDFVNANYEKVTALKSQRRRVWGLF